MDIQKNKTKNRRKKTSVSGSEMWNREPRALEIKTTQSRGAGEQGRKGAGGGTAGKKDGDRRKGGEGRGKKGRRRRLAQKGAFFGTSAEVKKNL